MQPVKVLDLFTSEEISQFHNAWMDSTGKERNRRLVEALTSSGAMERIDKVTKQKNEPRFWAYLIEFVFMGNGRFTPCDS